MRTEESSQDSGKHEYLSIHPVQWMTGTPEGDQMDPRLEMLLSRLQATRFSDLRGARADVTLPISDRLLNDLIATALPPSAPVRDLELTSKPGNRIAVRFKVAAASFLPPMKVTLVIEGQPELPASPILVLKLEMGGLQSLAGPASRFLSALPPGISIIDDRVHVNLATLLAERGLAELLDYAEQVRVTTAEGAVVVAVRAGIRGT
jgi:hypothetical protein